MTPAADQGRKELPQRDLIRRRPTLIWLTGNGLSFSSERNLRSTISDGDKPARSSATRLSSAMAGPDGDPASAAGRRTVRLSMTIFRRRGEDQVQKRENWTEVIRAPLPVEHSEQSLRQWMAGHDGFTRGSRNPSCRTCNGRRNASGDRERPRVVPAGRASPFRFLRRMMSAEMLD
jgi:hypothetical protein